MLQNLKKKTLTTICLLLFCCFIFPVTAQTGSEVQREPSFSEIMQEVFRREKLTWESSGRWEKAIKKSALLPTLSMGYDRTVRQTQALDNTDNISVTTGGVLVGPDDYNFYQTVNQGDVLRIHAVWQLGNLIFSPSLLPAFRERRELTNDRLKMTEYVYKIYAERREWLVLWQGGKRHIKQGEDLKTKIKNLTEKLNALTGSSFEGRWKVI